MTSRTRGRMWRERSARCLAATDRLGRVEGNTFSTDLSGRSLSDLAGGVAPCAVGARVLPYGSQSRPRSVAAVACLYEEHRLGRLRVSSRARPGCRAGSSPNAVEQRASRRPGTQAQADQATNVWSRQLRSAQASGASEGLTMAIVEAPAETHIGFTKCMEEPVLNCSN